MDGTGWQDLKSLRQLAVGNGDSALREVLEKCAYLGMGRQPIVLSPKVRHCPRQRSRGSLSLSITTVLSRLAIVVEAPVRLHHHGPGARAVAEGEARAALILVDAPLGHAIDEPPTHLGLERRRRQAELGRQKFRVDHDLPVLDADDGRWALHARTQFN